MVVRKVDHFIFVPGFGANQHHPAGQTVTSRIAELSGQRIVTKVLATADEVEGMVIPHSIDRQVDVLRQEVSKLAGRVALFAHSHACVPVAKAIARGDLAVQPRDVIFAGSTLERPSLNGFAERASISNGEHVADLRRQVPSQVGAVACFLQFSSKVVALTEECLASRLPPDEHLANLRQLPESTLLISGNEEVTDCTPENVSRLLPHIELTTAEFASDGNGVVLTGAPHNLRGFCERVVPDVVAQRIPGIL